jgi:chromosome partitioning protein
MTLLADLVLVPAGASMADLWATGDVLAMVTEAESVKRIEARLVWTRYRGFTNQAKALTEQARAELGIKALATTMGLRVAYVDALGMGLTAAETPDAQAKAEVQSLVAEVCAIIK